MAATPSDDGKPARARNDLTVPLTQKEYEKFERLRRVLDIPKARYARILLRYAMEHPKDAVAEAYDQPAEEPDGG